MTEADFSGTGTATDPWVLQTPSLHGGFQMHRDEEADPPALVCTLGSTELRYHLSAIEDLHQMLEEHGDRMPLGSADEQKPAKEGTVEAWGRSSDIGRRPRRGSAGTSIRSRTRREWCSSMTC